MAGLLFSSDYTALMLFYKTTQFCYSRITMYIICRAAVWRIIYRVKSIDKQIETERAFLTLCF